MSKRRVVIVSNNFSMSVISLLSRAQKRHDMGALDSLHWDVLVAIMEAQRAGKAMTNQDLVDLKFTSRSSTYRKIADMRRLGILSEKWDKGTCALELGTKALAFFDETDGTLHELFKSASA